MEQLKQTIIEKGIILNGNILKVDNFINHQIDPNLMDAIGNEFYEHFKNKNITKPVSQICQLCLNHTVSFNLGKLITNTPNGKAAAIKILSGMLSE